MNHDLANSLNKSWIPTHPPWWLCWARITPSPMLNRTINQSSASAHRFDCWIELAGAFTAQGPSVPCKLTVAEIVNLYDPYNH